MKNIRRIINYNKMRQRIKNLRKVPSARQVVFTDRGNSIPCPRVRSVPLSAMEFMLPCSFLLPAFFLPCENLQWLCKKK